MADVKIRKKRRSKYLETLKALRKENIKEILDLYYKYYHPMIDLVKMRKKICAELDIASTTYYDAVRQNKDVIAEFTQKKDAEYGDL